MSLKLPIPTNQHVIDGLKSPDFFVTTNEVDDNTVELNIFKKIGSASNMFDQDGVTAESVVKFLNENKGKDVIVHINSPGGLAFDGIVIFNALKDHGTNITTIIEGMAGSAAGFIAMVGDKVIMQENAQLMFHRGNGVAMGNRDDFMDTVEFLDRLDLSIAKTIAARSKATVEEVQAFMKGEGKKDGTFFTAAEALEHGFIDEIIPLEKDDDEPENQITPRQADLLRIANCKLMTRDFDVK